VTYELFKRTSVRVLSPTVSVVPDGRIVFNAAAVRILLEAGIKAVFLFWDRAGMRMAIKGAPKSDRNAHAVSFTYQHTGSLRAKGFLAHIGWSAVARETLSATWSEKEKMFEVALPALYLAGEKSPETKRRTPNAS